MDWQRVTSTQRFDKLVGKELTEKDAGDIVVVGPLRNLCESEYPNVMAAFYYYSASDGDMSTNHAEFFFCFILTTCPYLN